MCEPALCTIRELSDGSLSIDDIADFNELLNLKDAYHAEAQPKPKPKP